jgi:hypothetical protein
MIRHNRQERHATTTRESRIFICWYAKAFPFVLVMVIRDPIMKSSREVRKASVAFAPKAKLTIPLDLFSPNATTRSSFWSVIAG